MKRIILFIIIATFSKVSYSYSYGITGYSGHPSDETCSYCHYNGAGAAAELCSSAATFNYTGVISTSTSVSRGSTSPITFNLNRVNGTPITLGGMGARISGGTFSDQGSGFVTTTTTTATHNTTSNTPSAGNIAWVWDWLVPTTPGNYSLYICGNPTNGLDGCSGDGPHTNTCKNTTITVINNAPIANNDGTFNGSQFLTVSEGASATNTNNVLNNDSDADSATASDTFSITGFDTSFGMFTTVGTVIYNNNGTFSYDPNGQFEDLETGETYVDRFRYTITDSLGATDTAVVFIRVNGSSDAPDISQSSPQAVSMSEDSFPTAFALLLNATDDEDNNSTLTWNISSTANNGTAVATGTGSSKSITYTPNSHFFGTDSFDVTVTDSTGRTDTITVDVTVNSVNDVPTISQGATTTVIMNEDGIGLAFNLTLNASDIEGDSLTWSISSNANNGVVSVSGTGSSKAVSYTPTLNYNGSDTFIVQVNDNNDIDAITVTVTINAVADNPIITEGSNTTVSMSEDGSPNPFILTLNATDAENDGLTWSISSVANNGTAVASGTGNSKVITYMPILNYTGTDNFVVLVTDDSSSTLTDSIIVNVNISAVNDPPEISEGSNVSVTMDEDSVITPFSLILNASDPENDTINWSVDINANNGVASVSALPTGTSQVISYIPSANFNGTDTFIVETEAGSLLDSITVNVTINAVNDAPVIAQGNSVNVIMDEDSNVTPFILTLNGSDIEGDTITWSILTNANNGSATVTGSGTSKNITYSPTTNYNGADSFIVQISDGNLTDTITVNVTINPVNDPPVIIQSSPSSITINEDAVISDFNLSLSATDTESNTLTWIILNQASNGVASASGTGNTKAITYVPASDFYGSDTFTVQVSDSFSTDTHVVNITINPINDSPILNVITNQAILEQQLLTVISSITDIDLTDLNDGNGSITWSISSGIQSGMLISNVGVFTWTPPVSQVFNDIYQVTVSAQDGLENGIVPVSQTFTIMVNPVDSDSDGVADYNDFCPATIDSTNADNDNDGTAGSDASLTDNVGGDVCDADDDNDGMPDTYELLYNFDPFNSADANTDFDGDGITNVNEFLNGSEPKEGFLSDVTINSTGYLTAHNLVKPDANNINTNATAIKANNDGPYRPGINNIIWTLSNASNASLLTTKQNLNVIPLISFDADQIAVEGGNVVVNVSLNGDSVVYPVVIDYTISGTSDTSDHDAVNGSISINQGNDTAAINIAVNSDSLTELDETIVLTLTNANNAVIGSKSQHIITIKEGNVAPIIDLNVTQVGVGDVAKVYVDDGVVTVNVSINDPNSNQNHTIDWSSTDNALTPPNDTTTSSWSFNPSSGTYELVVKVMDDGLPAKMASISKLLLVTGDTAPVLTNNDTDGDGTIDSVEGYDDDDSDGIPDYLDSLDSKHLIADQTITNSSSLVLQTEPGLKLFLGNTAIASGTVGVALTDNEVTSFAGPSGNAILNGEDEFEHIGGVYDFAISGLIRGSSTYIIIPLQVAIPKNAVYRKYSVTSGWSNFVSDGIKNQVYSAKGSSGVCPEVQSSDYKLGLMFLDNCIQILIEDGGPNDQDGEVNGIILDPGVISSKISSPEEETVEKGGAFPYSLLMVLFLLFVYRQQKLKH